jgi:hypothetical protein
MFTKRFFGWILAALALVSPAMSADFWYGVDGPVPLKIDSLKATIKLESGYSCSEVLVGGRCPHLPPLKRPT